ncbi:response regulator [Lysobacter koreensis]|uniref:Response regulator n=1 Tax=Lysobacter koreensis TaxID=266122 RepID=A0ABW2YPC7_9GAMM
MSPLRIVLVDDHPIVRAGFKQLLELEPGWQVIAEVGSAQALAAWMLQATCDVLVLDLSLPDGDGLVMLRHLLAQRPELAIVVLTMHDGALYVQDALAAGARGYVTKRSAPDELVDAIRAIGRGEIYLGSDVRNHVAGASAAGGHDQLPELTAREAQVFLLLARGHSVARVAATIGINAKTAYAHRTNIYAKLKLGSDHELRLLASRRGLVALD